MKRRDTASTLGMPGTWVQIAQGRTLIGEGAGAGLTARTAATELGVEDSIVPDHNHGVTDAGHGHGVTDPGHTTPSDGAHVHPIPLDSNESGNPPTEATGGTGGGVNGSDLTLSGGAHTHPSTTTGISVDSATTGVTVDNEGVLVTDGNMQPSLVVYIFERTA